MLHGINTEVSGNYKSDRDEIYVFRPGETATDAGEGDIFSSYYGGEGMADEIGSLDFSDGVSDGALVYSDGTNSGIKISGITISEDDISFDVEFADTSSVSMWQTAGDISVNNSISSIDIASSDSGVYLVTGFGTHADLHRFVNGEWVLQGSSIGNGDYGSVNNVKLAVCGTTPYVLYNDSDYNMVLCGYNESSGTWEKKVSGEELAQYTDLASSDGKLWIAYTTDSYPYVLNAACFDPETGEYTVIGTELAENACNISLSCSGGTAVIAYRDLNDGSKPKAAVYDGNSWKTVTVSEKSCGSVTAAASGDKIWVAFSGTNSGLCCIEGDSISEIAMPEGTEESCYTSIPVMAGGKLYLAVNTQDTPVFSVYVLTSSGWEKAGNTLAENLVNDPSMICSGNTLYAAYITSSGTPVVKQYRIESEPLKGDVNLDGIVNIADAVMLQSHLLGKTALTSGQGENADVCEDNQLDAFDMSALRKLLLN